MNTNDISDRFGTLIFLLGSHEIVFGGLLSGCLHALSGPDHLAALMPFIVGKTCAMSAFYGAIWGSGHGISTSVMGIGTFFLKDTIFDSFLFVYLLEFSDLAIGITLVVIGIMGLFESYTEGFKENISIDDKNAQRDDSIELDEECCDVPIGEEGHESTISSESLITSIPPRKDVWFTCAVALTIFINGSLLGLTWDALPSLGPALSLSRWDNLLLFLASYCIGTMLTMSFVAGIIGLSTTWIGHLTSQTLPLRLAYTSSVVAAIIGLCWIVKALLRLAGDDDDLVGFASSKNLSVAAVVAIVCAVAYTILDELGFCRYFCSRNNKDHAHKIY